VQDDLGFIWFGTQYGLNRFDGYRSKVFKHEPGQAKSLNCVYIRSLFIDHSGTLWVGCDRSLDKFDPITETFTHFFIETDVPGRLPAEAMQISEDRHTGMLWLATARGLYRLDPNTGQTIRYAHDPAQPASIAGSDVRFTGEDRTGRFWVAGNGGLDAFDRKTGKVTRHVPFVPEIGQFHQDNFGVFWITSTSPSCALATLDLTTNHVTCHSIYYKSGGATSPVRIYSILESREGTIWLNSTQAGLLKVDRQHKQIISYYNHPEDSESLGSNNVIFSFQDAEENIWACLQETEPNFFSEIPEAFENFTYRRGSLVSPLVTSIYEDHKGILWIGSMGGLNRVDRGSGSNTVPSGTGVENEILSMLEDHAGVLFAGTFHKGLQRLDPKTGAASAYVNGPAPSNLAATAISRLIFDHQGTLWAATFGGVSRFDNTTGNFITYTLDKQNSVEYQEIKEDGHGILWLGATQSGLHRFDPRTQEFTVYEHDPNNPRSLSDNRVNSVHFDRTGNMWVGTQNGLDEFEPRTATFKAYYQQDGLAGDVVSCILEDERGRLWMSTNKGLSSFDPQSHSFQNLSLGDGVAVPDLTGWGACYKSATGEMFLGGFSGAIAFYPDRITNSSFVPRTVFTEFRLSGKPVPLGSELLKQSITYTDAITLSHQQNMFSIEFSALSYFNAESNRYRYRLDRLDNGWHEVGSNERAASYTTLPAGTYDFVVQGATSHGRWSEPGATLRIQILPAWYQTLWFRSSAILAICAIGIMAYRLRLQTIKRQWTLRFHERLEERNRIARELHDTLLQSFHGLILRFQAVRDLLPAQPEPASEALDFAIDRAAEAVNEGRNAVQELRGEQDDLNELGESLATLDCEFRMEARSADNGDVGAAYRVLMKGTPRRLHPVVRDDLYRIAREAVCNAFRHAHAKQVELGMQYDNAVLRLWVRDDGVGIDPQVLRSGRREGHYGLPGMRERAKALGGRLEVSSELRRGTEVGITIPGVIAYARFNDSSQADILP
jgi:signal transduction histidine kinase/ligand-binding sensor domain-containing protein